MCVICCKPRDIILTEDCIKEMYSGNKDGAGFAYFAENIEGQDKDGNHVGPQNEVCIVKGIFDLDKFFELYEPHKAKQCLLHFRISTGCRIDGRNCHPFRVNDNLVYVHNGHISLIPALTKNDNSDTWNYNESILKPLISASPDLYLKPSFKWMMEASLSTNNKIVFLDSNGQFVIINEKLGEWNSGVWFSNKSYMKYHKGYQAVVGGTEYPGYIASGNNYYTPPKKEEDKIKVDETDCCATTTAEVLEFNQNSDIVPPNPDLEMDEEMDDIPDNESELDAGDFAQNQQIVQDANNEFNQEIDENNGEKIELFETVEELDEKLELLNK